MQNKTLVEFLKSGGFTNINPTWKKYDTGNRFFFTVFTGETPTFIKSGSNLSSTLNEGDKVSKELEIYVKQTPEGQVFTAHKPIQRTTISDFLNS